MNQFNDKSTKTNASQNHGTMTTDYTTNTNVTVKRNSFHNSVLSVLQSCVVSCVLHPLNWRWAGWSRGPPMVGQIRPPQSNSWVITIGGKMTPPSLNEIPQTYCDLPELPHGAKVLHLYCVQVQFTGCLQYSHNYRTRWIIAISEDARH